MGRRFTSHQYATRRRWVPYEYPMPAWLVQVGANDPDRWVRVTAQNHTLAAVEFAATLPYGRYCVRVASANDLYANGAPKKVVCVVLSTSRAVPPKQRKLS